MFRQRNPNLTVYNSAVVGFSIPDYKRVIDEFVPAHSEVKTVYLFYCLNDFHAAAENNADETDSGKSLKLKAASVLAAVNEFFGENSKLYVYVTGKIIDPSKKFFETDFNSYHVEEAEFNRIMQPLSEISRNLKARNVEFVVFINPYEMQLRRNADADLMPQRKIENYLTQNGIDFVDTMPNFRQIKSADGFLFADPMHLSEKGHQIVFDALNAETR